MFRVAIVGAGQMAQGYDGPQSAEVLTHAHAFTQNENFEVSAFCDVDIQKARNAASRWSVALAVSKIEELSSLQPQVISVCTPAAGREEVLSACLSLGPKLVFCEKPLALDNRTAERIRESFAGSPTALAVNYSRRWFRVFQAWRRKIESGQCGRILSVRARYFGGWRQNGTHIVDLLQYFFEPRLVSGFLLRKEPFGEGDATLTGSATLDTAGHAFSFHFECLPNAIASHFEIELVFDEVTLWSGSRATAVHEVRELKENPIYAGYRYFDVTQSGMTDPSEAMKGAVSNIEGFLLRRESLLSTGDTACESQRLGEQILQLEVLS